MCAFSLTFARLGRADGAAAVGAWVTGKLIELGARKGELLVPTADGCILMGMCENTVVVSPDDAMLSEMFAPTDFKPVVVPYLLETDEPEPERGEVLKRRFNVRANRARLAQANTMANSRSHGPVSAR